MLALSATLCDANQDHNVLHSFRASFIGSTVHPAARCRLAGAVFYRPEMLRGHPSLRSHEASPGRTVTTTTNRIETNSIVTHEDPTKEKKQQQHRRITGQTDPLPLPVNHDL